MKFVTFSITISAVLGKNLAVTIKCQPNSFTKFSSTPNSSSMSNEPATAAEILKIISSLNDNKAPGLDNIGSKLLKLITPDIIAPLLYIFNLSFDTGQVPQPLEIAKVIPIYKKGERHIAGNYRPISLLSIFNKILEKLMFNRLITFLEKHNILYKYQFGFRKGYSTSMALIELLDSIYLHRDNRDIVIAMYLDLQKA